MGKVLIEESSLQNIANAIRSKNGEPSTTKYTPAQMATAVGQLSPPADDTKWQRPQAWPQYTDAMLTNQEVLYFTVDLSSTETPYFAFIAKTSTDINIDAGTISNGVFTTIHSYTPGDISNAVIGAGRGCYAIIDKSLYTGLDYISVRITPTNSGHITTYTFPKRAKMNLSTGGYLYEDGLQPVVEIFGRLPYATLCGASSYSWLYSMCMTKSFTIFDAAAPATFQLNIESDTIILENVRLVNIDCTNTTSLYRFARFLRKAKYGVFDFKNTQNVTNLNQSFNLAAFNNLDLSGWDTRGVTTMSETFAGCKATSIDVSTWDTSNVTNMSNTFNTTPQLTSLDLSSWNVEKVTTLAGFFGSTYSALQKVSFPDNQTHTRGQYSWTSSGDAKVCTTAASNAFRAGNLHIFTHSFFKVPVSFDIQYSYAIGHDNLMNIINALPTVSSTTTATFGTTNKSQLTAEEIAIAENKGWTIA